MTLSQDPAFVEGARIVSGIAAGYEAHGVYRPDGSPVLNGTLFQGERMVQGRAGPETLAAIDERITGTHVYGGCVYGHFGHLMLETFARIAAFGTTDLPVLFSSLNHTQDALFWRFVDAVGLPAARIRVVDRPVMVERLVVPAPDFRIRAGINLPFLRAYEALGAGISARDGLRQNSNPVPAYLSRSRTARTRRHFFGETLIEAALQAQGCDILFMEELSLERQIAEILTRSHLVGFAGTAFHHLLFARGRKRVTYLSAQPVHMNFRLIESLKQNDVQELIVDMAARAPDRPVDGPFLLSKAGIAAAASVLGTPVTEADIDAAAYEACVEAYHETLREIGG